MLLHSIIVLLKGAYSGRLGIGSALLAWSSPIFAGIAVSEAFYGQVVSALIAAIPTTGAVVIALITLMRGQKEMSHRLDGKLDALMEARVAVGKAEGKAEERSESRVRQGEAAIAQQASPAAPAPVIVENPPDKPANVKQHE